MIHIGKNLQISRLTLTIIAVLTFTPARSNLASEQGTLNDCINIKDKIDYYTELRRAGGSSNYMNKIKKLRDEWDDKYTKLNCTKWKNSL